MFSRTGRRVAPALLAAAVLSLSAGQARAQGGRCQHNGQSTSQPQLTTALTALQTRLQNALQRLTALQASGQLTPTQLQRLADVQTALQQVNSLLSTTGQQNGSLTASQLRALRQQERLIRRQLRASLPGRRR